MLEQLFNAAVAKSYIQSGAILILGVILYLIRGWVDHVNQSVTSIWTAYNTEQAARELRWTNLLKECSGEKSELSRIIGFLQGSGLMGENK